MGESLAALVLNWRPPLDLEGSRACSKEDLFSPPPLFSRPRRERLLCSSSSFLGLAASDERRSGWSEIDGANLGFKGGGGGGKSSFPGRGVADEIQSLLCILLDRLKVEKRENTRVRSFCHSCGRDPSLSFLPVVTFDSSFLCLARKRRKGLFFSSVNAQSSSHTAEKPDPSHMRPEENGERSRRGPSPPFPKQIRSQSHTKGPRYDNDFSSSPKEENSKFLTISRIPSFLFFQSNCFS